MPFWHKSPSPLAMSISNRYTINPQTGSPLVGSPFRPHPGQSTIQESPDVPVWNQLASLLDEAMARLQNKDREAAILRFFKEKNLGDVAAALRWSESAALTTEPVVLPLRTDIPKCTAGWVVLPTMGRLLILRVIRTVSGCENGLRPTLPAPCRHRHRIVLQCIAPIR